MLVHELPVLLAPHDGHVLGMEYVAQMVLLAIRAVPVVLKLVLVNEMYEIFHAKRLFSLVYFFSCFSERNGELSTSSRGKEHEVLNPVSELEG